MAEPIDMILYCPNCGMQHIDHPEIAGYTPTRAGTITNWHNPPHRSHLCKPDEGGCGTIWRPADAPTNGVAELKTRGKADTWPAVHNEEVTAMPARAYGVSAVRGPLTDDEILRISGNVQGGMRSNPVVEFARAIEAAHGIAGVLGMDHQTFLMPSSDGLARALQIVEAEIARAEALLGLEDHGQPVFNREQTEAGICALRTVAAAIERERNRGGPA